MHSRSNQVFSRHLKKLSILAVASIAMGALSGCGGSDSAGATAEPLRCAAGDPLEPAPLEEKAEVTINVPAFIDIFADVLLADALGEFEKENLSVELLSLPSADAAPQVASGEIEVMGRGLDAGFFNARAADLDMRFVYPSGYPASDDKSGWWFSNEVAEKGPSALEGAVLASAVGVGSPVVLPLRDFLAEGDLTLKDVEFEVVQTADLPVAMQNGAVDGAYVSSPFWAEIDGEGYAQFEVGMKPPTGGYIFGPELLNEQPDVGLAFLRAIARTQRDYLEGDYLENDKVREALATAMDRDPETLAELPPAQFESTPDMTWDPVLEDLQETWLDYGDVLTYDDPLAYDELVAPEFAACLSGEGNGQ